MNNLTNEDIKKLKEIIVDNDSFEDGEALTELKSLKEKISTSNVNFAILTVKAFDLLEVNQYLFESDKELSTRLKDYITSIKIYDLRNDVNSYEFGESYGDFIFESNMKSLVNKNRESYLALISNVIRIFTDD